MRELLFLLRLMLGVEPLLYLTIDLSLTFRVSLLLLARRKDRQRDDEQQSKNLFHGKALDYKFAVIFEQRQSDFFALNRAFSRCVVAIVQDEILTHIVFSFSLTAARSLLPLSVCGCCAKFLVRKQLHDTRNRPTDTTVHIHSWVVASYRPCDNRSTAPNQL